MKMMLCRLVVLWWAVVVAAPVARGDVWRMAGTFNGWNAGDGAWELKGVEGAPGKWRIERVIAPGSYKFKFVRNGDWGSGHFGAASGSAHGLATPGEDIALRIAAPALYRVELDESGKAWSMAVAKVEKPVIVAHRLGAPVVGEGFVVDVSESLRNADAETSWEVSGEGAKVEREGLSKWRARVIPAAAGPLKLTIKLKSGGVEVQVSMVVEVAVKGLEPKREGMTKVVFVPPPSGEAGTGGAVWTVHVSGDFNDWANPGEPGSIELGSLADGSFEGYLALPEGAYRYRLVLNGDERVRDVANERVARADDGTPCSVLVVGREVKDFGAVKPANINSEGIRHNPGMARDFRAVSSEVGIFDVSVLALPGDVEQAFVHTTVKAGQGARTVAGHEADAKGRTTIEIPMHRTSDASGFDRWSARVMTGERGDSVVYSLAFKDGSAEFITKDYRGVLKPNPELPSWAMGAVWYQIFVERFRNGNPLNDPHGPWVTLMPWTSDWNEISEEEARAWKKRANIADDKPIPGHMGGPLYNVVWDRRYGGDLQGVVQELDYIKSLGVTAIYLNPIFEAESMHKYDATDYRHIDDNFGAPASAGRVPEQWSRIMSETEDPATWTWTAADRYFVDVFLPEVHKRGMHVVLDGVFNHTGQAFWAFDDIQKKGDKSPYTGWYYVDFDSTGRLKSWTSWFNTGALPKFRQKDNGDLVEPVKQHIFNITRRWMDPNGDGNPSDGIDGWRLDVALDVGLPFWRDWRKHVKSINPDAVIIAEIWDDASAVVKGDSFDTHMHYPFARAVTDWLAVRPGTTSTQMLGRLNEAFDDSAQTNLIHQNLMCSHDTDRYVSMLFNPGRDYDGRNRLQDGDGQGYKQSKPPAEVYRLSLLGVAIQAMYLGAPMIYYGDEVGMFGADDPSDRKPFPWSDLGRMRNEDDAADATVRDAYKKWFGLRSDPTIGQTLRYGSVRHIETGVAGAFAFTRELNGRRVVTVVNRDGAPFDAKGLLPEGTADTVVGPVESRYWVLE